ncbi:hypothetical protein FO519_001479 [Halicephalobus sp. NKZ332]|nr:hypothetical protein FO519_001479 [Halicephalobus sp. NKZ332]
MVQSTLNKLFKNDTCLCGINVKQGAEIFATIFLTSAIIRGILNMTFSLITNEPAYCSWLIYHILTIIFCFMVLTAERRDEAWFYLPMVAMTGIFGLSKVFIGIVGLISVAFDLDNGKLPVFGYIPRYFLTEPGHLERDELEHHPYVSPVHVDITCIVFSFVLVLLGFLNCYTSWVTLRAYHQMKHSDEYIVPRTACNTNYKSPKQVEVTAYSPSDVKPQTPPVIVVDPNDATPVAPRRDVIPAVPHQDTTHLA